MTFFSQFGWDLRIFVTQFGFYLSCVSSCARQHTCSSRFGVCGIEVLFQYEGRWKFNFCFKLTNFSRFPRENTDV